MYRRRNHMLTLSHEGASARNAARLNHFETASLRLSWLSRLLRLLLLLPLHFVSARTQARALRTHLQDSRCGVEVEVDSLERH